MLSNIKSDAVTLIDNFLEGVHFEENLANLTLNLIDRTDYTPYHQTLKICKNILSACEWCIYKDICFVKTEVELSKKELAVVIRFINICHKSKSINFISLNDEIVFINHELNKFGDYIISDYIKVTTKMYHRAKNFNNILGVPVIGVKDLLKTIKNYFNSFKRNKKECTSN